VEYDFGNAVACSLQSWNWLKNRRGEDDKLSRRVWKAVETKAGKVRVAEAERGREKGRKRKEVRREGVG